MRLRHAASLFLLALSLTACSGTSDVTSLDPVAQAADKTAGQKSIRMTFSMSGGGLSGTGSGVFNTNTSGSGRLSMTFDSKGERVRMDAITEGFVLYLKSPIFSKDPSWPKGKTWLKIDLKKAAKQQGINLDALTNTKPTDALAYLRGSNGRATKVGKDTIAGIATTHYRATIDLERAAREASGDQARSLRKVIQLTGSKTIPIDVWIDGRGFVRKESYKQHFGAGQSPALFTMVFGGFGQHVAVEPPPPDEVFDATKIVSQAGG